MMNRQLYLSRALKAADWFVNHMIREEKPVNDANHGRVMYNYHVPSKLFCPGIGWSNGRAIMVLLAAHNVTKNPKYRETAITAAEYIKTIQVLDRRKPYFGIFREETPQSTYAYPRDSTEVADALIQLYRNTGDREYLYRARLFFDFYASKCIRRVKSYPGPWPWGRVIFEPYQRKFLNAEFHGGSAAILYRYWRLTGEAKWKRLFLSLTDTLIKVFYDKDLRTLVSRESTHHHGAKDQPIENDDGCGVALVAAYVATGKKKYLEVATNYADYLCTHTRDITRFAAPGVQTLFLMDMYKLTKRSRYRKASEERAEIFMKRQVLKSSDRNACGGFIGEDENPDDYVEGSKKTDFVVTRTTAYSTMALFKLAGRNEPTYSAFGWGA
jgi:lantibiotic modifying enzyme